MKRKLLMLLIVLLLVISFPLNAFANENEIKIMVNGNYIDTDVKPYFKDSRTMVPVRFISETLGYNVEWNGDTEEVTIQNDVKKLVLKIGSKISLLNNEEKENDVAPEVIDGRTFVPVRFIAENFDLKVDWDGDTNTVIIGEPISISSNNHTGTLPYIGNKNSKKLHYSDCGSVQIMKDKNKVVFEDRQEAINKGYEPCKSCNP